MIIDAWILRKTWSSWRQCKGVSLGYYLYHHAIFWANQDLPILLHNCEIFQWSLYSFVIFFETICFLMESAFGCFIFIHSILYFPHYWLIVFGINNFLLYQHDHLGAEYILFLYQIFFTSPPHLHTTFYKCLHRSLIFTVLFSPSIVVMSFLPLLISFLIQTSPFKFSFENVSLKSWRSTKFVY